MRKIELKNHLKKVVLKMHNENCFKLEIMSCFRQIWPPIVTER